MMEKWCEIGQWNVGQPCGGSEKFILERNTNTGVFRIKNEFGNIQIDLDVMAGLEFLKKVTGAIEDEIERDIDEWLKGMDSYTTSCVDIKTLIRQTIDFGKD